MTVPASHRHPSSRWTAVVQARGPRGTPSTVTDFPITLAHPSHLQAIPWGFKVCEQMEADHQSVPFSSIMHIGDIAYGSVALAADGVEGGCSDPGDGCGEIEAIWDLWAQQVQPLAANITYFTGVGNHEKVSGTPIPSHLSPLSPLSRGCTVLMALPIPSFTLPSLPRGFPTPAAAPTRSLCSSTTTAATWPAFGTLPRGAGSVMT